LDAQLFHGAIAMVVIRHLEPPAEALNVARAGLRRLCETGAVSSPALRRVPIDQLRLTRPQPVYLLGLDELRDGRGLDAARSIGWRYFVEADDLAQPLALAETVALADGSQTFAHLNYGPFVAGTAAALSAAEQTTAMDAEIRLLHVPALYFVALWLLQDSGDPVLVPVAPVPPAIVANRSYPARELLDLLTTRARALPIITAEDNRGI
jgi:hypothetical protein